MPFSFGLVLGYGLTGPLPGLLSGAVAALKGSSSYLAGTIQPLAGKPILVMGIDKVGANTDVIFTVEIRDGATRVTQVPRDTYVESEHYGVLKANALYAFGGMDGARRELGGLLKEPIDRYLLVNLQAVERVADALGGVEVDVPRRLYYVDDAQGLYIDLYPGPQVLRGEELEGFLRFRNDPEGDLGRMARQRQVLEQVFRKLSEPTTLTRLPELLRIAGEDIQTNLTPLELGQLLTAMASTQLTASQLPGRLYWYNDLSFWMPDANPQYGRTPEQIAAEQAGGEGAESGDWSADRLSPEPWAADGGSGGSSSRSTESGSVYNF
ncbi:LCP family protein [Cyanobium sp. CH-040]|uniref:LCP family protein n=1 Tax=Cyanobium sp. CH-040 TaxID=2823708 RepID=UPI0020CF7924|nr:LCP family protein [Cyanobium sp. CH-040]